MKKFIAIVFGIFIFQLQSLTVYASSQDYVLEKVFVFSRHNLRAPLVTGNGTFLSKVTPHKFIAWTDNAGELSSRGGTLETLMGQYFRKWLENEKFFPENHVPTQNEVRFYANSAQRTIATAKYFSAALLPLADISIERHSKLNKMDPVFYLNATELSTADEFKTQFQRELSIIKTKKLKSDALQNTRLLEKVIDFKNSAYAKENKIASFLDKGEEYFTITADKHILLGGSLRPASKTADALILQHYESENSAADAFGHKLTFEEWQRIGRLQSLGLYHIYHLPSVSKTLSKPLLTIMKEELTLPKRKFTFICGHDTNVITLLSALEVEDYNLKGAIEPLSPIGVKLAIEKRKGADGESYVSLKLIYQSIEQIKNREPLSLKNPPIIMPLKLKNVRQNNDGLYLFDDFLKRLSVLTSE